MSWQARAEKAEADNQALVKALEEIARPGKIHGLSESIAREVARAALDRIQDKP